MIYTICVTPHLCLGRGNESLQNEADRSILSFKYVFVLVSQNQSQNYKSSKQIDFPKLYDSKKVGLSPFDLPTSI